MAWERLDITKPHLVYIILGGFTSLFMLCSSFIKERMYIGEATVATLCGVIFGPHAANLINPSQWGSVDIVTVEFSRIVLVVQCFAVGVELPRFYMERHWRSVVLLLVPVMMAGWLLVSLFVWWMMPALNWLESLVVAACVTATDPVLASSVVGKGKFAKRVPKHLRDLLSAESGCNDGMAFPFLYLSIYLIRYNLDAAQVSYRFVVLIVLYECVFGAIYGFTIGYIARHGIKFAEQHDLIDRESFLVFYFVVALFCAGSGSILGLDDLLVGFSAGVGFSNDGWFGEKTEESHVSNVIDLLLNLTYFVYFGTIIPWEQYNNNVFGLVAWRLVVIAIFVLLFRRIPIMLALKPFIPDIKNWREALFAGHFGPMGVGAIFMAILARAELENDRPVPLSELPPANSENYVLIYLVWPIVTFLVISSILIHGSSIAVFTLGKRINTLSLTMSYTTGAEDGHSWINRLPRISSQSRSQAKNMSEMSMDDGRDSDFSSGLLAPPPLFLSRQREEEEGGRSGSRASSTVSRKRKHLVRDDGMGPGGPISQSAIFPSRPTPSETDARAPGQEVVEGARMSRDMEPRVSEDEKSRDGRGAAGDSSEPTSYRRQSRIEIYDEGGQMIIEDEDGNVLEVEETPDKSRQTVGRPEESLPRAGSGTDGEANTWSRRLRRKMSEIYSQELAKRKDREMPQQRHAPARAYQFGNMVIVEDKDGEVVKTYELPSQKSQENEGSDLIGASLKYFGLGARARQGGQSSEAAAEEGQVGENTVARQTSRSGWTGFGRGGGELARKKSAAQQKEADDDKQIRFTIGDVGRRMTKEDFIREVQKLDAGARGAAEDGPSALAKATRPLAQGPARSTAEGEKKGVKGSASNSGSRGNGQGGGSGSGSDWPLSQAGRERNEGEETEVETRGRTRVAAESEGDERETGETPAERRRRQAALGMSSGEGGGESDSEDEGTPRVPPERRGIRFAEPQQGREGGRR